MTVTSDDKVALLIAYLSVEVTIQQSGGGSGLRCPFCLDDLASGDALTACPECSTSHHAECYAELGGCTVWGCAGRRPTARRERA